VRIRDFLATNAATARRPRAQNYFTTVSLTRRVSSLTGVPGEPASAAGANSAAANGGAAYVPTGTVVGVLPNGSMETTVRGQAYYLNGNTWYQPAYGANGVYYRVVPAP
jgi:hypothetical protein